MSHTLREPFVPDAFSRYARNIIKEYQDEIEPLVRPHHTALTQTAVLPIRNSGKGVGIVGGGVGGLYAAMMLQSVGVDYEILEANEDVGGRLYTYHFDKSKPPGGHEYIDIGAMRFPETPMMKRTFHLFDLLERQKRVKKVPYFFSNKNSSILYNKILKQNGTPLEPQTWDYPFPEDLPKKYEGMTVSDLVDYVLSPFVDELAKDIQKDSDKGWEELMKYDKYSMRAYMLLQPTDPKLDPKKLLPYPSYLIDFLEAFDNSTGSYDRAFSEAVLDQLAFAYPGPAPDWWCLDGGSQTLAYAMRDELKEKGLNFTNNFRVRRIALSNNGSEVEINSMKGEAKTYTHVITTTTLSCLRVMDLDQAELDNTQSIALRELAYGPSTKIGVEFKTQWWTNQNPEVEMPFGPIKGGQSSTDRCVRTVVYPSYGETSGTPSRVLMVNYAWTHDAVRLTGLISSGDPEALEVLKDLVFRDLIAVHGLDPVKGYAFLQKQFVAWYPFSWTTAPNTMGAFAFFGPGQFKYTYTYLKHPAAKGRLYFAGEAVSTRHAWVVGALDASWNAVRQILCASYPEKIEEFEKLWGKDEDWNDEVILKLLVLAKEKIAFPVPRSWKQ